MSQTHKFKEFSYFFCLWTKTEHSAVWSTDRCLISHFFLRSWRTHDESWNSWRMTLKYALSRVVLFGGWAKKGSLKDSSCKNWNNVIITHPCHFKTYRTLFCMSLFCETENEKFWKKIIPCETQWEHNSTNKIILKLAYMIHCAI